MASKVVIERPNGDGTFERLVAEEVEEVVKRINEAAEQPWISLTTLKEGHRFGVKRAAVVGIRDARMP